jgi:hypothetical protein
MADLSLLPGHTACYNVSVVGFKCRGGAARPPPAGFGGGLLGPRAALNCKPLNSMGGNLAGKAIATETSFFEKAAPGSQPSLTKQFDR